MSQLDTADRQTAAGEEPSETVLLTKTRLKEKLAKLEEVRVPGDRDHQFQAIVITDSRGA
jgi:hypothetical protein